MRGIRVGLVALSVLMAVGIGAFVSTHAASAQPSAPASAADRTQQASSHLTVTLADYSINSDAQSVPAGDVTFDVSNTGDESHEMIVFKSDLDPKALPPSATNKGEVDENQVGEYIGGFDVLDSGASANGTLVLAPGKYILLCNLTKHYENGMVTTLTVN